MRVEDLTRKTLEDSRCVCVTDGHHTVMIWQNPDDNSHVGVCTLVNLPEIRVQPIAELIARIRELGWNSGFEPRNHQES